MNSYHVYFSPKEGVSAESLIAQVHEFMATQIEGNFAEAYRLLRMDYTGSPGVFPDYHLIVDYPSGDDLRKGFESMKAHYRDKPHSPLMKMVSDFKVAFSIDETPTDGERAQ